MQTLAKTIGKTLAGTLLAVPFMVQAAPSYDSLKSTLDKLKQQMEAVQKALDEQKKQSASKTDVRMLEKKIDTAAEWKSPNTLIHMAGYADVGYTDSKNSNGSFNSGGFSPIFHFQYRDLVMLESELEFEIEPDGSTTVGMEYMTVDLFLNDYVTLVAGQFLSPIGQFRQNLHPSWINKMPSAAPGFGHDGAAPTSDTGVQLRGGFPLGSARANYAVFVSNGPELTTEYDGSGFELDGIKAEGFSRDFDGKKVWGGRFGILPVPKLEFGISAASGKATVTSTEVTAGTAPALAGEAPRDYDVIGVDFAWQYKNLNTRGEYIRSKVGAASAGTSASGGATWSTWYTQAAYRFMPSKYEGVIRYANFNAPGAAKDQKQVAVGLNYLFANNVVAKIAYENNRGQNGSTADENRVLVQLAYGF